MTTKTMQQLCEEARIGSRIHLLTERQLNAAIIAYARRGIPLSEEHKRKISESMKESWVRRRAAKLNDSQP